MARIPTGQRLFLMIGMHHARLAYQAVPVSPFGRATGPYRPVPNYRVARNLHAGVRPCQPPRTPQRRSIAHFPTHLDFNARRPEDFRDKSSFDLGSSPTHTSEILRRPFSLLNRITKRVPERFK